MKKLAVPHFRVVCVKVKIEVFVSSVNHNANGEKSDNDDRNGKLADCAKLNLKIAKKLFSDAEKSEAIKTYFAYIGAQIDCHFYVPNSEN